MLARVLFVLLAGVPVCRGAKGAAYSAYYDADGDVQNADFYDSYNDEIISPQKTMTVMEPITRLKRRDLDDIRTLNPEGIIDVKGVLNNILQGKKTESVRGRRTAGDYSNSYDYLENSVDIGVKVNSEKVLVTQKWQPTGGVQKWSSTGDDPKYLEDSSNHATEQHWSFVYQPDTSTADNNDIVSEVSQMISMRDAVVPSRSSIDDWRPTQKVKNWASTEETEETEDTLMYPLESTTYSNSDMQAEVRRLVQHWSPSSTVNQETSSYNNAAMRADVKQLIQHWSPSSNVQLESHTSSGQHWEPSMAKEEMNQQKTGMQTELKKLPPWKPILQYKHWSAHDNVQQHTPSDNVQHWSATDNVQHQTPSDSVQHWSAPDNVQHQTHSVNVQHRIPSENVQHQNPSMNVQYWNPTMNVQQQHHSMSVQHHIPSDNVQHQNPSMNVQYWNPTMNVQQQHPSMSVQNHIPSDNVQHQNPSMNVQYWNPSMNVQQQNPSMNVQHHIPSDNVQHQNPSMNFQYWNPSMNVQQQDPSMNVQYQDLSMNVHPWSPSDNVQHQNASVNVQHWNPIAAKSQENLNFTASKTDPPSSDVNNDTDMDAVGDTPKVLRAPETTTLEPSTTLLNFTTTLQTTTTTQRMDIDAIMAIISNLTYDYEWNLTEQFNKTIIEHGVPTCPWEKWGSDGAWTATTTGTTLFPWNFENTPVISKCFVCGLHTPEIPRNAFCSDAFAGDFLPLMPIDARSRGKVAGFRKYCRYIDTQNYIENPDEPRAIYGRFTGGCAVRWTDITGVYTQRTCRSKYRPLLGKHFASKRMAKLELALVSVDNGCIISPMATLLPVSRGISLYARFHACVCNTNWCNRATILQAPFNPLVTILLACILLLIETNSCI